MCERVRDIKAKRTYLYLCKSLLFWHLVASAVCACVRRLLYSDCEWQSMCECISNARPIACRSMRRIAHPTNKPLGTANYQAMPVDRHAIQFDLWLAQLKIAIDFIHKRFGCSHVRCHWRRWRELSDEPTQKCWKFRYFSTLCGHKWWARGSASESADLKIFKPYRM